MKKHLKLILGLVIGGLLGFSYYYFIGCYRGQCPITSNPIVSTIFGAFFGLSIAWPLKSKRKGI